MLVKKEVRGYVVKKEQQRLQGVRQAVAAAKVIQRWYRLHQVRSRHNFLGVPLLNPSSRASPNPGMGRRQLQASQGITATRHSPATQPPPPKQDKQGHRASTMTAPHLGPHAEALQRRRRLVAALTIQLWWRRLLAGRHATRRQRALSRRSGGPHLRTQEHHVKAIYGTNTRVWLR